MTLSAHAESIILLVPFAESMILSAPLERRWATPVAQWAAGRKAIAVGQWDSSGTMDGTMLSEWSVRQNNFFVLSDLCFFC
jgi:hypothetical protein